MLIRILFCSYVGYGVRSAPRLKYKIKILEVGENMDDVWPPSEVSAKLVNREGIKSKGHVDVASGRLDVVVAGYSCHTNAPVLYLVLPVMNNDDIISCSRKLNVI